MKLLATEAYEIANEANSEIHRIEEMIRKKSKEGKYECYMGYNISYDIEKELVIAGYTVEHVNFSSTVISWRKNE